MHLRQYHKFDINQIELCWEMQSLEFGAIILKSEQEQKTFIGEILNKTKRKTIVDIFNNLL